MRTRLLLAAFLLAALPLTSSRAIASTPLEISSTLCRSGGGVWTFATPVVVSNSSASPQEDRLVTLSIAGTPESPVFGALPLAGQLASSIRVCNSDGVEYLFNIVDAEGRFLDKGRIPATGATLTFPANVPGESQATYYVYGGNERAYLNVDRLDSFRKTALNLDFEQGEGQVPNGWSFDVVKENCSLTWTDEESHSGKKSVKCVVPAGTDPNWTAARQTEIAIQPGAKYRLEAWVKGQDVDGRVGWYVHVGNEKNRMVLAPIANAPNKKDYDWTQVSYEFTAPDDCDLLSYGTALYGTGTAWFDDARLIRYDADGNEVPFSSVMISKDVAIEKPIFFDMPAPRAIYGNEIPDPYDPNSRYAVVQIPALKKASANADLNASEKRLVQLNLAALETRWGRDLTVDDVAILGKEGRALELQLFDSAAFFETELYLYRPTQYLVVEKRENVQARRKNKTSATVANQAFPGTMLQTTNAENASTSNAESVNSSLELPSFIVDNNILKDGGFETIDPETLEETMKSKDGRKWSRDASEPDVEYSLVDSGIKALGKQTLRVVVGDKAALKWRGWRRSLAVEPGQTYCVGYAVRCESQTGNYDMHLHWHDAKGKLAAAGMSSIGKPISGSTPWSLKCNVTRASNDAATLTLHLTNQTRGLVEYDNVFVFPISSAEVVGFYGGKSGAFQVPAVVKVFTDTTFAHDEETLDAKNPARVAMAKCEEEPLQIALRGMETAQVAASRPTLRGAKNKTLDAPELFAVGNVLVDYPSSYYNIRSMEKTTRKFPSATHSCDGWIGYWPDPLIPIEQNAKKDQALEEPDAYANDSVKLAYAGKRGEILATPGETRALWLRFRTDEQTAPGVYEGVVTLTNAQGVLRIPYEVEVFDFIAPETKVAAIYDSRIATDFFGEGTRTEKLRKVADKLLERKLSPDQPVASPKFSYDKATKTYQVDWTDYDEQCARYFDELGGKAAYFPHEFYLFGWGNPPKTIEGETPYEGEYPYEGEDRAALRKEYKEVYQAKLKLFWEHIKAKGWADKMVLYISDEPFYSKPEIIEQMKALCDMIHEVDPAIPIYSSTWVFVPEWLGYLDVWGVGHYGGVSEESLKRILDAGGRIWWTTDGQMCLDTPLCATERLLPYACVARGAEVYEFWGATWFTCDPFESASHFYISQSDQPGVRYYVRYPNGDGYIFYPGELIGREGEIIESIRSVEAAEGIEDAGWLVGLKEAIAATPPSAPERKRAEQALRRALDYLPLACGSGRYSSRYMPNPKEFERIREDVGRALEALSK